MLKCLGGMISVQMMPVKQALNQLKRMTKGKQRGQLTLLTKKKDRSIVVQSHDNRLILLEQGYRDAHKEYSYTEARHAALAAFKREFPRSHQVYFSFKTIN